MNAAVDVNEIRKEGFVLKESAIIRQYRKRWLVLTRTHLYTFKKDRSYSEPTEVTVHPRARTQLRTPAAQLHERVHGVMVYDSMLALAPGCERPALGCGRQKPRLGTQPKAANDPCLQLVCPACLRMFHRWLSSKRAAP